MWAMLTKLEVDAFLVIIWAAIYFLRALIKGWGELSLRKRFRLLLLSLIKQQKVGIYTSLKFESMM